MVGKNWSLWKVKDCVLFNLPVNQDLLIVLISYFLWYDLEIVVVNCGILCNFLQLVLRLLHNEISVYLVLELKALETQQHHFLSHVLMETVRYLTLNFLLLFPNSTCLFCHSPQQWTLSTLLVYFEKTKASKNMTYIKTTQVTLVPFDVKIIPGNKLAVAFLALFCQVLCSPTIFCRKTMPKKSVCCEV